MRRLLTILCTATLLVGIVTSAPPAANAKSIPSATRILMNDEDIECLQLTPHYRTIPVLATGVRQLRVAILRDRGVSASRAAFLLNNARRSYSPLKIRLVLAREEAVNFRGRDSRELIEQAKAHFGGRRPPGADVVAIVTSADITDGAGKNIQGLADCIGGVGYAHRAFVVSEDTAYHGFPDPGIGFGPVRLYVDFPSKVLAHEIGHLMGAHHHLDNCVEGMLTKPVAEVSPCNLMGPSADLISFNFSALNGAVVRGHADKFLKS